MVGGGLLGGYYIMRIYLMNFLKHDIIKMVMILLSTKLSLIKNIMRCFVL